MFCLFFFNDTATTEIYTLSLHDALPIYDAFMFYGLATGKIDTGGLRFTHVLEDIQTLNEKARRGVYDVTAVSFQDRKSTRLNSSHANISYAVFCLKKKTYKQHADDSILR